MPPIADDTPLIEVFLEASNKVFGAGSHKTMHLIPELGGYLLGMTKYHRFLTSTEFFSSLASSTALTTPHFFAIPKDGLLPLSYGKAVLSIPSEDNPSTPLLGIHRLITGQTLLDFYGNDPEVAKRIMATWSQETFEDLMQQGLILEENGHAIDSVSLKNMIVYFDNATNPKLSLIDPTYGNVNSLCGAVDVFNFFGTKYFGKNPPELLEKLFCAAEKVGFGIPPERKAVARASLEWDFYSDEVEQIMVRLSCIPPHHTPKSRLLYNLPSVLQEIRPLSLHSTLRDLRACVLQIEEADKTLRNNPH